MTTFRTFTPYKHLRRMTGPWYEPDIRVIYSGISAEGQETARNSPFPVSQRKTGMQHKATFKPKLKRPRRAVYEIFKILSFLWIYLSIQAGRNRIARLRQEVAPESVQMTSYHRPHQQQSMNRQIKWMPHLCWQNCKRRSPKWCCLPVDYRPRQTATLRSCPQTPNRTHQR